MVGDGKYGSVDHIACFLGWLGLLQQGEGSGLRWLEEILTSLERPFPAENRLGGRGRSRWPSPKGAEPMDLSRSSGPGAEAVRCCAQQDDELVTR